MKKIILFFLLLCGGVAAQAQGGLLNQDLRQVKVDQLSDADILYYYNRLQQAGISLDQAAQVALAKGMPQEEITKLQKRLATLVTTQKSGLRSSLSDSLQTNRKENESIIPLREETVDKKIFGSDLFNTASLAFEPNLRIATPGNYSLGPDDELIVNVFGLSEAKYTLKINPEGYVYIQNAGPIMVSGLTIEDAAERIKSKLAATIYKAISSGQTKVQVSLGNIRSIRVTVIGEAKKPGTYTVSSLATLFNVLYLCGGPGDNGTYRKIELVRNNKVYKTVDIYEFLLHGILAGNIQLVDGDVIRIPYYAARVSVSGEVKRTGIFEILAGDKLQEVLNNAGGFSDSAYRSSVKILQVTDKERKVTDVVSNNYNIQELHGGDAIYVGKVLNRYANRVVIKGAIMRPGQFELIENFTLKKLIQNADGIREDAFLNRGIITRLKDDLSVEVVSFDVAGIIRGTSPDILLKREDEVTISSIFDLQDKKTISIQGEVRSTGTYEFKDSTTIKDLIFEAGGFSESATGKRIEVARRVNNTDPNSTSAEIAKIVQVDEEKDLQVSAANFYLQPYDVVIVRNNPGYFIQKTVTVEGEILYPGPYVINSTDEKLSSIINRAGGFKNTADASAASLRRVNKIDVQSEVKIKKVEKLVAGQIRDTAVSDSLAKEAVKPYDLIGINLETVMQKPGITNDLILEDGDILFVPKKNQAVKVRGEVLFPTQFAYEEGYNMKYYINKAGGFNSKAQRKKAFVLGANGNARTVKSFLFFKNYPTIKGGDEIYVPPVPDRGGKGLSTGEVIGISSAVASLAAVVIALINSL
ncbi:MAG: SLBB domain-containing protein [Panacibacter sp.]